MNNPVITNEETVQIGDVTLVTTTFDDGEVVMVELDES